MSMSPRTREKLERAGWTPGRKVDASEYERALAADGYVLGPVAREFLEEFGGLVILDVNPRPGFSGDKVLLRLDPAHATSNCFPENVAFDEQRVHERLVVIGEVWEDNAFLLMSESGKVYVEFDPERLFRVGDNGCEALETLCEGIESRMVEIRKP